MEDASSTTRSTWPKRVLSWWWSTLTIRCAAGTRPGSTMRLSCAQSTATSTRSPTSGGARRSSPRASSSRNAYSSGSGWAPPSTITESFPRASSARCVASSDPSASPSGLSCDVTTKRWWREEPRRPRSCHSAASSSPSRGASSSIRCVIRTPVLDRAIVDELEVRGPPELELAIDPRLEHPGGAFERHEGARPLLLRAEDAEPDLRVLEVARRLDGGHGDESDPRVLEGRDRL